MEGSKRGRSLTIYLNRNFDTPLPQGWSIIDPVLLLSREKGIKKGGEQFGSSY